MVRQFKPLVGFRFLSNQLFNLILISTGPFWVPTTLIFSLFLTSSLSSSITAYLAGQPYAYDFTRLGAAVSLVLVSVAVIQYVMKGLCFINCFRYAYFLGLPVLVWLGLKYWAGVHERSAVEMISLYGYASTVWILTSVSIASTFLLVYLATSTYFRPIK